MFAGNGASKPRGFAPYREGFVRVTLPFSLLDPAASTILENLHQDILKVVLVIPPWKVLTKLADIADPPNVVTCAIAISICPPELFPRNVFA
jgi:hypothetical protein